jgi:hypothetical protein
MARSAWLRCRHAARAVRRNRVHREQSDCSGRPRRRTTSFGVRHHDLGCASYCRFPPAPHTRLTSKDPDTTPSERALQGAECECRVQVSYANGCTLGHARSPTRSKRNPSDTLMTRARHTADASSDSRGIRSRSVGRSAPKTKSTRALDLRPTVLRNVNFSPQHARGVPSRTTHRRNTTHPRRVALHAMRVRLSDFGNAASVREVALGKTMRRARAYPCRARRRMRRRVLG